MDITLTDKFLNAEYEVIVEDDCITTSKIYIDGEMVSAQEYTLENGGDVPFNRKNIDNVYESIKAEIKQRFEKNMMALA